jgi:adenine phosphoribosyltransferase
MTALSPLTDLDLASLVRTIPDFPAVGIQFRDITTLIGDAAGFAETVRRLCERAAAYSPDVIVAVEARGFLFGAAMAVQMGLGLALVRKAGKLPGETVGISYDLEYGQDRLELHVGSVPAAARTVLVDDLLATGGTVTAAAQLLRSTGAEVAAALFVIDLPDLGGGDRLNAASIPYESLIAFDGE